MNTPIEHRAKPVKNRGLKKPDLENSFRFMRTFSIVKLCVKPRFRGGTQSEMWSDEPENAEAIGLTLLICSGAISEESLVEPAFYSECGRAVNTIFYFFLIN